MSRNGLVQVLQIKDVDIRADMQDDFERRHLGHVKLLLEGSAFLREMAYDSEEEAPMTTFPARIDICYGCKEVLVLTPNNLMIQAASMREEIPEAERVLVRRRCAVGGGSARCRSWATRYRITQVVDSYGVDRTLKMALCAAHFHEAVHPNNYSIDDDLTSGPHE